MAKESAWEGKWEPEDPRQLKTATGMADPVLIRLSTARQHVLLLAENVSYDRAGLIRLYMVRSTLRERGWKGFLRAVASPELHPQINLRRDERSVIAGIPGQATLRVGTGRRTFAMIPLSRVQYEAFRTATPRRLLQASRKPRRSAMALAFSAVHRLRFAVQRAMLAAAPR